MTVSDVINEQHPKDTRQKLLERERKIVILTNSSWQAKNYRVKRDGLCASLHVAKNFTAIYKFINKLFLIN